MGTQQGEPTLLHGVWHLDWTVQTQSLWPEKEKGHPRQKRDSEHECKEGGVGAGSAEGMA